MGTSRLVLGLELHACTRQVHSVILHFHLQAQLSREVGYRFAAHLLGSRGRIAGAASNPDLPTLDPPTVHTDYRF